MNIIFIPLDNRPCTMNFPEILADIVNYKLIMPPSDILGNYVKPGHPLKLLNWLEDNDTNAEAAIISIDMIIYGGLIASRSDNISDGEVLYNTEKFENWLKKKSVKTIYLSCTIMRNMPTFLSQDVEKEAHAFKKTLARLYSISQKENPEKLAVEVEKVKKTLKGAIKPSYFDIRKRNHQVNQKALLWCIYNYADHLVLGLDDVVTKGLNIAEKEILENIIEENGLDNVSIYSGTDEMSMMLLARLACKRNGFKPTFHIHYSEEKGKENIPLYEDRTVKELFSSYIALLDGTENSRERDADIELFVNLLGRGQLESHWQYLRKSGMRSKTALIKKINDAIKHERIAAVADIAYANGADSVFSSMIEDGIKIHNLSAYAAWNTTGNTIGTVIAHAVLRFLSLKFRHNLKNPELAEKAHHKFIFARFVDDWLFQSETRDRIRLLCQKAGISIFDLAEEKTRIENITDDVLMKRVERFFSKALAGSFELPGSVTSRKAKISIGNSLTCQIRFPWERIFEISVECDFDIDYKPVSDSFF